MRESIAKSVSTDRPRGAYDDHALLVAGRASLVATVIGWGVDFDGFDRHATSSALILSYLA
jgi:hypothetical protein